MYYRRLFETLISKNVPKENAPKVAEGFQFSPFLALIVQFLVGAF